MVLAGSDEHERARAEGRLRVAVRVQRRLLVAGERRDGQRRAEQPALAEDRRRRMHIRQQRTRHCEELEQLVAPVERREVEQHRARRVRDVRRVHVAARQLPQQPRVDGAEREPVGRASLAQDPLELRRREVRIGREPGAGADLGGGQLAAALGGAPVLPHDRRVDRSRRCVGPRRPSSRAGSRSRAPRATPPRRLHRRVPPRRPGRRSPRALRGPARPNPAAVS